MGVLAGAPGASTSARGNVAAHAAMGQRNCGGGRVKAKCARWQGFRRARLA